MTLNEYRQEIKDDLSQENFVAGLDGFYTDAVIDRAINRSIRNIGTLYRWQQTEDALEVTPEAAGLTTLTGELGKAQEYYNYPSTWVSESIRRVTVRNVEYKKVSINEYLRYREQYPNGTDKIWADYGRQYFINPNEITGDLTKIVSIWGNKIPATMSAGTDTNPFSLDPDIEEGILKYAQGILYKKGRGTMYTLGQKLQEEAIALISALNVKQRKAQAEYGSKGTPFFERVQLI